MILFFSFFFWSALSPLSVNIVVFTVMGAISTVINVYTNGSVYTNACYKAYWLKTAPFDCRIYDHVGNLHFNSILLLSCTLFLTVDHIWWQLPTLVDDLQSMSDLHWNSTGPWIFWSSTPFHSSLEGGFFKMTKIEGMTYRFMVSLLWVWSLIASCLLAISYSTDHVIFYVIQIL